MCHPYTWNQRYLIICATPTHGTRGTSSYVPPLHIEPEVPHHMCHPYTWNQRYLIICATPTH